MRLVLDTNIYIASLLYEGLCFDLMRIVFDQGSGHEVYTSNPILVEIYNKIASKKEQISSNSVEWLIFQIKNFTLRTAPKEKNFAVKRDPSDNKILECAVSARADLIITMDKDLLKLKSFRGTGIIHPKTFLYMLPKN